jgi:hypothetical protein
MRDDEVRVENQCPEGANDTNIGFQPNAIMNIYVLLP